MAGEVTEVLYCCAICKTIFEIVRNHIRPPSEPLCDVSSTRFHWPRAMIGLAIGWSAHTPELNRMPARR